MGSDRLHCLDVIRTFRHKGLRLLYSRGDRRRVDARSVDKIERILARLEVATKPLDMELPGFRLHLLTGRSSRLRAVSVSGNWRIIFRFEGPDAYDVDLLDYH